MLDLIASRIEVDAMWDSAANKEDDLELWANTLEEFGGNFETFKIGMLKFLLVLFFSCFPLYMSAS